MTYRAAVRVVVPAHAGVIRGASTACRSPGCRPRTRGGHPAGYVYSYSSPRSSPHTRGSSVVPGQDRPRPRVVPAHAGVIRRTGRGGPAGGCRPRTRGGHPSSTQRLARMPASSPHTRGSSAAAGDGRGGQAVVPAHAGVIPIVSSASPAGGRRPRTRGGHPLIYLLGGAVNKSSPHTRGSSGGRLRPGSDTAVVPAHAGVIPHHIPPTLAEGGRPRTRGGHPTGEARKSAPAGSSPHTRGSSQPWWRVLWAPRVVPAHAGVIRAGDHRHSHLRSRPRTRGGHPLNALLARDSYKSSPHTRGSSARPGPRPGPRRVVPAHAGVIPSPSPLMSAIWRRPRTRGGHPASPRLSRT